MLQPLNYKQAVIEALEKKTLSTLKELHKLKNKKQIYFVDSIDKLQDLTPDKETGYLFAPPVKSFLEGNFISSVLYGTPNDYAQIYTPDITADEILAINKELELRY